MRLEQALSLGLSKHVGEVLTEEDARKLAGFIMWATQPEDRSFDPTSFPTEEFDGMTFQVERMRDVVEEIKPLHLAHWQETETHRHRQSLNPNYAELIAHERAGQYVLFTVRDADKRLVGNCAVYIFRSNHTQELEATEDTMFVLKEVRKGRELGVAFFQYCERMLLGLGVTEATFKVKILNAVWRRWRRLGYEIVAYEMSKQLRRANDATQV